MSGPRGANGRSGRGVRWRLFLTCWVIFALHFATNVVREHYPALALAYQGDFVLDDYAGLHPDIFEHDDGHHYINNQVIASVLAAPVVVIGRPALDVLLDKGKAAAERAKAEPPPEYDTEYSMRAEFFRQVKLRGIDLQLGGLTALTSALFMAPVSALLVLLLFDALLARGLAVRRATWLALVFGLGTPVFYRAAILNHNQLMALAAFASFLVLFRSTDSAPGSEPGSGPGPRTFALSGLFAGFTLALDYSGVVALLSLFAYALLRAHRDGGWGSMVRNGAAFVVGTFPPVFLLWGTQWAQFGHPFMPAQFWMEDPNEHVNTGFRGMGFPDPDLVFQNLFDPDWGLFAWAPVLLLALVPWGRGDGKRPVAPRLERWWVLGFGLAFLLFSSGNQFARLQWNTGFRYFAVLLPFLFLLAAGPLARLSRGWVVAIGGLSILHGWAMAMVRYTPPVRGDQNAIAGTYERLLDGGLQFPWHNVLLRTGSFDVPLLGSAAFPYVMVALLGAFLFVLWRSAPWSPREA